MEEAAAGPDHVTESVNVTVARNVPAAIAHVAGSESTVSAVVSGTVTMMTVTVSGNAVSESAVTGTVSASTPPAVLGAAVTDCSARLSVVWGECAACSGNLQSAVLYTVLLVMP